MATPVYLEVGQRRTFACSLEWPGWCRSGKREDLALEALADYVPRYAMVASEAGVRFPASVGRAFDVVERLPGSAATDFGVPGAIPAADSRRLTRAGADRLAALVEASWRVLDRVVAAAPPTLQKGPRGGGRDRDPIVDHVLAAESSYVRKLGLKIREPAQDDRAAVAALREAILDVLRRPSDGSPPVPRGWPIRYAARRIVWHVLDHVWEIEDKS